MKKLFKMIFTTTIALMLFTIPTFAMSSVPTVCNIASSTDSNGYSINQWVPKSASVINYTGNSVYLEVHYNGYGSNYINVDTQATNSFTVISTVNQYRFGDWIGYISIIRVDNLTAGNHAIEVWRLPTPYTGTTIYKDSISVSMN